LFSRKSGLEIVKEGQWRVLKLVGISKDYVEAIVLYSFSGNLLQNQSGPKSLNLYLTLLIYADYFALTGLVDIFSQTISDFICVKNVLPLYLIAQAHNVKTLESECTQFIAFN
jgi:hypothetical protein